LLTLTLLLLLPGQIETISAPDFPKELQVAAVTATVQIVNVTRQTSGSGAIIGRSGPLVYILTANHVVDKAEELEVRTFSARSYPKPDNRYRSARLVDQMPLEDLALVRLATSDPAPGTLKVCPPRLVPQEKSFPALTAGCSGEAAPTCLLNQVKGKKLVRKLGEEGTVAYWELAKAQAKGRSGGPLVDKQGYLLGIASLVNDDKGYCCHIESIHGLLRRNGLSYLYGKGDK
jgi:S1-C subfamily serine protease